MGQNSAAAAASALRLLSSDDLRHTPARGLEPRRSAPTTSASPVDLGLLDYLDETRSQVVDHTRAVAGQHVPLPDGDDDLYDWYIANTGDADADQRAIRDETIETHRLEHAIRLGEYDVVCKEPCPRCGRWGLMWDEGGNRARCTNRRCHTRDGLSSSWTPARLAAQKIRRTEMWRRNAT